MPLAETEKNKRYLRQVIVVRKDLTMPVGKLAAMVAHASMEFIVARLQLLDTDHAPEGVERCLSGWFSEEEYQWFTELDPGLEEHGQKSFAKIVLAVDNQDDLEAVQNAAIYNGLVCHPTFDSGYSHNPAGTFVCIAIGPDRPENIDPVTKHLKVYR